MYTIFVHRQSPKSGFWNCPRKWAILLPVRFRCIFYVSTIASKAGWRLPSCSRFIDIIISLRRRRRTSSLFHLHSCKQHVVATKGQSIITRPRRRRNLRGGFLSRWAARKRFNRTASNEERRLLQLAPRGYLPVAVVLTILGIIRTYRYPQISRSVF